MKWKTRISKHENGELFVYGRPLLELVEGATFTQSVFLMLRGKMPTEHETQMLDAMLVSTIEHGIAAPSAFVPRVVASTGNSVNAALAAGVLSIGDFHGGAIEACAKYLQSSDDAQTILEGLQAKKAVMPGLGHKLYKDVDPRAEALFEKANELGLSGLPTQKLRAIQEQIREKIGKSLPINIDGAIAAIMSELGFDYRLGKALFVLGRMPGMIAHTIEEMTYEKPYRRLDDEDVEYLDAA